MMLSLTSTVSAQSFPFHSLQENDEEFANSPELRNSLTNIFLQLMTRPGIADRVESHALRSAAQAAGLSFNQSIINGTANKAKLTNFRKEVGILIQIYQNEYSLAPEGLAGAEVKAAAFDRLLDGLLQASIKAEISYETLNLAFLNGAAAVEKLTSEPSLTKTLSLTERELTLYILRTSIDQIRRRSYLDTTRNALQYFRSAEEITAAYETRIYNVLRPTLTIELIRLENNIADPLFTSDLQNIISAGFNNEATCDIFALKYSLELYSLNFSLLNELSTSLAALIPGMTPDILKEQIGQAPVTFFAVLLSVTPQTHLAYTPVNGLEDWLALLGETPPTAPNTSLFPDPYRALIQLQYDVLLCDRISSKELNNAYSAIQDPAQLLSLSERLTLKESAMKRHLQIRAHLNKIPAGTVDLLLILIDSGISIR